MIYQCVQQFLTGVCHVSVRNHYCVKLLNRNMYNLSMAQTGPLLLLWWTSGIEIDYVTLMCITNWQNECCCFLFSTREKTKITTYSWIILRQRAHTVTQAPYFVFFLINNRRNQWKELSINLCHCVIKQVQQVCQLSAEWFCFAYENRML